MQPATIEHVVPGRIRLKFYEQRGNTQFFEQLVSTVSQHPAVEEARANPLTGSVLVRHTGPLEELARAAVQLGIISRETLTSLMAQQQSATGWGALLNRSSELPALALSGLGALQLLRGRALGPASEHFWHAREMWSRGMPQVAVGLALLALFQLSRASLLGSATSLLVYGLMLQDERQAGRPHRR